jgi:hypothetical protein
MLEQFGELLLDAAGQGIVAVGERDAVVRPRDRGEDLRRDRRRVVAGEIHFW